MSPRVLLGLVLLLTFGVFAPSLGNGFAMDDAHLARPTLENGERNAMVGEVRPLGDYFSTDYWHGAGQSSGLFRPVTVLSFALTNGLRRGSVDPRWAALPHHMLNLLLHLASVLLVFALVRSVGGTAGMGVAGAAVFGLHAIHTEVVANIVGRAELFAFVFGASAAVAFLYAQRLWSQGRGFPASALHVVAACALFAAFGSKESALAWAPFLAVLGWVAGSARSPVSLVRQIGLAAMVSAVPLTLFLLLRADMLAGIEAITPVEAIANPLAHVDAKARVQTAASLWAYGMFRTVVPWSCCADYGPATVAIVDRVMDTRFLAAMLVLVGALVGGLAWSRRSRWPLLAVTAFFGFGFLTSNVPFAIGTIFGERLYYTPSLALSFLAAGLVGHRAWRRWGQFGLAAWLLASAAIAIPRSMVWKDDATLFLHEAAAHPQSSRVLVCAAIVYEERGELDTARELLRRAVAQTPHYALAWNNLGALRLVAGDLGGAGDALRRGFAARWGQRSAGPMLARTWSALQQARAAAGLAPQPGPAAPR